jgi:dienelactone hydrolase
MNTAGRSQRFWAVVWSFLVASAAQADHLPGTQPLTMEGNLAKAMVEGIDKYLTRQTAEALDKRKQLWKPDFTSATTYEKSVLPNRQRLKRILGVVDPRVLPNLSYVGGPAAPALVAETDRFKVYTIRWESIRDLHGEGLLLEPKTAPVACVVAIPDADHTPEMIVGLTSGVATEMQFARRLVESGCRVIVPVLIDRKDDFSGNATLGRMTNQPHREFIYRMAYQMGRHIIGYELQKILAAVDWLARDKESLPVGIYGHGEGALLALYAAAIDDRIRCTLVNGYFGPREELHDEPIYRNIWGLLREFGDAELVDLIVPRTLVVEAGKAVEVKGPPRPRQGRGGAAPGQIRTPTLQAAAREMSRMESFTKLDLREPRKPGVMRASTEDPTRGERPLGRFLQLLANASNGPSGNPPKSAGTLPDPVDRQRRQFNELVSIVQLRWRDSDEIRRQFWGNAFKAPPAKWEAACETFRNYFWEEVIGKLPKPTTPTNPRTRAIFDEPKWKGYEVVLDLYPDVFAQGILLVPNDLKPGEKRPVVVCQHGLEGQPIDVVNPKEKTRYYNSFGAQLADLGFVVYAPQNPYIFQNQFRQLQRKANPLGLSLFSFIIRQHETTTDWLATLPFVDPKRIAFYGLSYGGKTAMRVPAVVKRYCLSICSGDFNEWIGKNVSVSLRMSYMFSPEYEMYEFDLGSTFNYAEMAYLIAPRPFMVERGHDDGVGIDEMVAYEFAKVRYLYANRLKLADRAEIEFFPGGHEINLKGTLSFLTRHLDWPKPDKTR